MGLDLKRTYISDNHWCIDYVVGYIPMNSVHHHPMCINIYAAKMAIAAYLW